MVVTKWIASFSRSVRTESRMRKLHIVTMLIFLMEIWAGLYDCVKGLLRYHVPVVLYVTFKFNSVNMRIFSEQQQWDDGKAIPYLTNIETR